MKRFTEPVRPVRAARSEVPEEIERALLRALARTPDERFATASEFSQALSAGLTRTPPDGPPTVVTASHRVVHSIAVLPFADMSPAKDQDYFCEGIAEEIINALTKLDALQVASRSSAFAFKGKNQDIRQVGEQLNVATVMEGSVRKAGNRLRITAQLIKVADGYHLWSERYDRDLEDVFAVQDEIAANIVRALRVVLTEEQRRAIERPHTGQRRGVRVLPARAAVLLPVPGEGTPVRPPDVQPGHRDRSRLRPRVRRNRRLQLAALQVLGREQRPIWSRRKSASRKALELAPDLAEAHAARGFALTLGGKPRGGQPGVRDRHPARPKAV